jgi:hypothetical protein
MFDFFVATTMVVGKPAGNRTFVTSHLQSRVHSVLQAHMSCSYFFDGALTILGGVPFLDYRTYEVYMG